MRNIDHAFDQYLVSHEREAVRAIADFEERLEKSFVKFGRFVIPTFFKPQFIMPRQQRLLKEVADRIISILNQMIHLYFTEPLISSIFHFSKEAKELFDIDPGYSQSVVIARLDSFLEGEGFKLVELNTDSPAGMGYADILEEMIFESEMLEDFFRTAHVRRENRRERLLEALLRTFEEFGGSYERPHIGIIDWRTVKTRPEFETLKLFFEEKGYPTMIADPRDLRYRGGRLYFDDFRIDLLYRRVIFAELLEKLDEVGDLIRAYRDKAICMINPLRSRLGGTKAVLSVLTNPGFDHFFTEEENRVKRDYIPWTRRVVDAEKFYGGKKVYLIDFLKDEKESLVLKPSEGYGGKDVVIGGETRDEDWNRTMDRALKGDWVIQEFVPIPIISVPTVINGRLDFLYKKINFNPFVFGKKYSGSFARLSDESVINVAKNGGLISSVTVEEMLER